MSEKKEEPREINTGGGAYIGGKVQVGGDFAGRDMRKTVGVSAADAAQLFEKVYAAIAARANSSPDDKADLQADVEEVQQEAAKGEQANESFLARRLRNIERMAPDILDVVLATLANPVVGLATVVNKIRRKIGEAAGQGVPQPGSGSATP